MPEEKFRKSEEWKSEIEMQESKKVIWIWLIRIVRNSDDSSVIHSSINCPYYIGRLNEFNVINEQNMNLRFRSVRSVNEI